MAIRAGGHIDRGDGKGWVLDAPGPPADVPAPAVAAEPVPPPAVVAVDEPADVDASTDTGEPETPAETPEGRADCPDCGRDFAVNKDGTLRKHTCVIEAPAPAVTFDDGEG